MVTLARLSHVGFNVPRPLFEKECDFWEHVVGLKRDRRQNKVTSPAGIHFEINIPPYAKTETQAGSIQ